MGRMPQKCQLLSELRLEPRRDRADILIWRKPVQCLKGLHSSKRQGIVIKIPMREYDETISTNPGILIKRFRKSTLMKKDWAANVEISDNG